LHHTATHTDEEAALQVKMFTNEAAQMENVKEWLQVAILKSQLTTQFTM